MNYEQKYKEALECAKTLFESQESSPGRKKWLSDMFPELRESEDERMRKAALEGIEHLERNLGWDAIGDIDILKTIER